MTKKQFHVEGHEAFLISPEKREAAGETPWVWYAPTLFPGLPGPEEQWMIEKFTDAGIAFAGIDVGESYGSRQGRALYCAFYDRLMHEHSLSPKPVLLARSRGGLMLYNWAAEHPSSVAAVAGIYPVCNLATYPGLSKAAVAFGLSVNQLEAELFNYNPIDRLEPLAKARVPIFHLHGDNDIVVPLNANSAELAKRYANLGGDVTLRAIRGGAHDMWEGWFLCQELVDFVIAQSGK